MTSETPGRSLSAKETALWETPARRAMSFIVGRRAGDRLAGMLAPLFSELSTNALEWWHPKAH
ncbi:hypothetical protein GCM10011579_021270 [Streptomyces albiflavescens]|uniref:Uncharacterized protein n=1 Tax=Streptomyces albiflavescens TaxID=1623582 RepID=A0A918D248_9ACTN|nr:hypothetical protein GCM10011579_021270 [Streptomyces albiflavescens]